MAGRQLVQNATLTRSTRNLIKTPFLPVKISIPFPPYTLLTEATGNTLTNQLFMLLMDRIPKHPTQKKGNKMKKVFLFIILCIPVYAQQQPRIFTAADYARAERFLAPNVTRLVTGGEVTATWLPDDRFWYGNTTTGGLEYVLIDPEKRTRTPYSPTPADTAGVGRGGFRGFGRGRAVTTPSPDGKREAFIRDWNLWVRDIATKQEQQLTTDGVKDFGYATDNAGWTGSERAILLWSPDSRKIATQQQDERNV